ncbi:MAG TPA: AbrB/MazE/SpoVT family DNA-binding domain-containing protein [Rhizomicrobium sp.]
MDKPLPGTKLAERMLTRPQGATMSEIIAVTGGPQYNVLRKLKAMGCAVRQTREGRETRYSVTAQRPVYEMAVNDKGQVTLPKGLREEMRVFAGQTLEAAVEDGKIVLSTKTRSIRDMFGILGKPPNGKSLTNAEIRAARGRGAVERYLRSK